MKIGNVSITTKYGAELLDFAVEPCRITDNYFTPPNSMRPIPLKGRYGTRVITLLIEFTGASENAVAANISKFLADLIGGAEITLPDGYSYYCVLSDSSAPERVMSTIYTVDLKLEGVRHGVNKTITLSESGTVAIEGQLEAPAKFTISGASGTYSVNGIMLTGINGTVVIDGVNKTVKQNEVNFFSHCSMTRFPYVTPKTTLFSISGTGTLKVEYQPIYL